MDMMKALEAQITIDGYLDTIHSLVHAAKAEAGLDEAEAIEQFNLAMRPFLELAKLTYLFKISAESLMDGLPKSDEG